MTTAWLVAATGLVAGLAHVVLGPDHLAAVLPLAARSRSRAVRVGALWGLGHGLGVLLFGLLGQLAQGVLDLGALPQWSELMVGVLLIGLGLWTLHTSRFVVVHTHAHVHDASPPPEEDAHDHAHDHDHAHPHVHIADPTVASPEHLERGAHQRHTHSAFGFGLLHGTAGAGHLFGVLPSLVLGWEQAIVYLSAYLVSAVAAMAVFAWLIGRLVADERRLPLTLRISGVAALIVGVGWVAQTLAG